jgi:hypothetical protein
MIIKNGFMVQMDDDFTFSIFLGVESNSSKPAQSGPDRIANRDMLKKCYIEGHLKLAIFLTKRDYA